MMSVELLIALLDEIRNMTQKLEDMISLLKRMEEAE